MLSDQMAWESYFYVMLKFGRLNKTINLAAFLPENTKNKVNYLELSTFLLTLCNIIFVNFGDRQLTRITE